MPLIDRDGRGAQRESVAKIFDRDRADPEPKLMSLAIVNDGPPGEVAVEHAGETRDQPAERPVPGHSEQPGSQHVVEQSGAPERQQRETRVSGSAKRKHGGAGNE